MIQTNGFEEICNYQVTPFEDGRHNIILPLKVALLLNTQAKRAMASKNVRQGISVFEEDKDDEDEDGNPPASRLLRFEKKTSR